VSLTRDVLDVSNDPVVEEQPHHVRPNHGNADNARSAIV